MIRTVRSYWIEKKNERKKMKMEMRNYRENERDDEKIDRRRSVGGGGDESTRLRRNEIEKCEFIAR